MSYLNPVQASRDSSVVAYYGTDPYLSGYKLTHLSTTQVTLGAGAARSYDSNWVISFPGNLAGVPDTLTLDTTQVGALGCSPVLMSDAAPVNNTSFGVYVLGDSSGKNDTTAVIATGDNFLLPGYDKWRRVGVVQNVGGSDNLVYMVQTGLGVERKYLLNSALAIISGGSSTGPALVDCSSANAPCNPAYNSSLSLNLAYTPVAATSILSLLQGTAPVASPAPVRHKGTAALQGITSVEVPSQLNAGLVSLYYQTTDAGDSVDILLSGFSESMGLEAL